MSLKISQLPVAGSVLATDVLPVVSGGVTKQVPVSVLVPTGAGTGTVTSVDVAVPADMTAAGGPVTTAGTITLGRAAQAANAVLIGPTNGAPATPTYRALVAADIPALAESAITNLTTDLNAKAPLASPTFSGPVSAPGGFVGSLTGNVTGSLSGNATGLSANIAESQVTNLVADLGTLSTAITARALNSRTINTTAPLSGGGDLSADRTIAFSNQTNKTFLAGPTNGGAPAAPAFRAIINSDLPAVTTGVYAAMASGFSVPALAV